MAGESAATLRLTKQQERRLCSACRVHVAGEFLRPAPWIGEPPRAKVGQ